MGNTIAFQGTTPVLIVGGGPAGLGLALELAWRKIPSILVEQGDGVVRLSKMGAVSVRSMEYCRRWGVADAVANSGFPHDHPHSQIFCTSLNGKEILTVQIPGRDSDHSADAFSPEKKQRCPQLWFDPILQRKAAADPLITLVCDTRFVAFSEDADGVSVDIEDVKTGERGQVRAQYLVGCDGGGSAVRKALGFQLEGERLSNSVGIYFTSYDLLKHQKMPIGTRYWMLGEEGTWANLTVVDGKDIWRLTVTGTAASMDMEKFDADYWLRRCFGDDTIEYSITAVLPWWRNRMVANHYGKGRVHVAGDACHMNAPNGGFGMNTGLGDSVDIGWKLQGVLEGWASPDILATYETERRPIAQRNVDAAARNFTLTKARRSYAHVEEDSPQGDATRAALREVMQRDTGPEWETLGVHLGYRYEGSPIVVSDGTAEPPDDLSVYVPTSRPGHRAPHFWLTTDRSILDEFGHGFVLLQFGGSAAASTTLAEAARRAGVPFRTIAIENEPAARLYERRLVLVRPDGHVAWRGNDLDTDPDELIAVVTGWRVTSQGARNAQTRETKEGR